MQRSGTFNQKSGGIRVLIFPLILAMGFTFGKLAIGASGTDVFAPLTSDMGYGELFHSSKNNNARFNLGLSYVYTADPVEIQGNAGDEEGDFENNLHGLHLGAFFKST